MIDKKLGRPFWTLWASFSSSNLGDGLTIVGMPLLAIGLTNDARLIAAVAVFQYLPFLLIGLPAGVVLDRFDRRWIAVIAQLIRAVVLGGLVVAIVVDKADIIILMVVSFLIGASEVMTDGGLPALVRDLVRSDQLEVANARLMATQRVTNAFIGPPVGALLLGLTLWLPFAVAAAASLLSVATLVQLPGQYQPKQLEDQDTLVLRLTTGLRYVWSHPVLRPLALSVATFSFAGAAGNAVFVVLVTERFGLGRLGFGFLMSLGAMVSVLTTFVVARFIQRTSHSVSMRFAIVCFSVGGLLLGFSTVAGIAFLAVAINGLSDPAWNIVSATVRQRLVPDEVFGRMMTSYLFIAWGMKPLGAFLGGLVAHTWGAQWVSVAAAVAVGSMLVTARPMFRRVDSEMAEPA